MKDVAYVCPCPGRMESVDVVQGVFFVYTGAVEPEEVIRSGDVRVSRLQGGMVCRCRSEKRRRARPTRPQHEATQEAAQNRQAACQAVRWVKG